jgi:hypothetical protein
MVLKAHQLDPHRPWRTIGGIGKFACIRVEVRKYGISS